VSNRTAPVAQTTAGESETYHLIFDSKLDLFRSSFRNLPRRPTRHSLLKPMALRALLFCQDSATVGLVGRAFRELHLEVDVCDDPDEAVLKLRSQRFEAIVVDDSDSAGAVQILEIARSLPACRNSLGIIIAQSQTTLSTAFSTGTHLVIYKPLSADRLRNSLRALRNLIGRRPQREFPRVDVEISGRVQLADQTEIKVSILVLGQGGLALSSNTLLPTSGNLTVEFVLPDRTRVVTASGDVVWRDAYGRIGLQFTDLSQDCREALDEWIASHLASGPFHRTPKLKKASSNLPSQTSPLVVQRKDAPVRPPTR
jgi:DNA-binding response OmpR family regulator